MARVYFILSIAFLAFVYGFMTRHTNTFPSSRIVAAINDVKTMLAGTHPHHLMPIVHDETGVTVSDEARMSGGLTLLTSYWPEFDYAAGIRLVNAQGDVVHSWRIDPDAIFADSPERFRRFEYIHGSYLFPNGDVVLNIELRGIARIDACGDVLWARSDQSHHSISRNERGNFWVSGLARYPGHEPADDEYVSQFPGLRTPLYEDLLREITPDGELVREISVLKVLYDNDLQRYLAKHNLRHSDVTHLNDIEELTTAMADQYPLFEAGDIVVSLKFPHLVFVMDPATGVVKWHDADVVIEQHDPDFTGDGWVTIFDNNTNVSKRGMMLGGSRIIAVQPHTGEREVWYPTPGAKPFYTPAGGKWQELENGNMLISEARAGRIFEATRDGDVVWEWINEPYDEKRVPEVLEASRYPLTEAQVAAWACAPE